MVLDQHGNFVFFCNAKTGSTTIRKILGGDETSPSPIYHITPDVAVRTNMISDENMLSLYKATFVRSPYERFLSTYLFGTRDQAALNDWSEGLIFYESFEEFVLDFSNTPFVKEIHFEQQIRYATYHGQPIEFVGKFETYHEDMKTLFQSIDKGDLIERIPSLPKTKQSFRHKSTDEYYNQKTRDVIKTMYREDFETFYPELL